MTRAAPDRPGTAPEPATAGQTAMFFDDQRKWSGCPYNLSTVLTASGVLADRVTLTGACRRLVDATPSLRLRMGIDDWTGAVVQWFSHEPPVIEWRDLAGADDATVQAEVAADLNRQFEVDDGPLVRFLIMPTGKAQTVVLLAFHHLVADGPSHMQLGRQLGRSFVGDLVPYTETDYLELARDVRAAEALARTADREYWAERIPMGMQLGRWSTGQNGAAGSRNGWRLCSVNAEETASLIAAAARAGVRPFHLLVAAIHRALPLAGDAPSSVCAATSVRPRKNPRQNVIGCFINNVPLTTDRAAGDSIERLAQVESPRWHADLRRRNFPFMDMAKRVATDEVASSLQLDSVLASYRAVEQSLEWRSDGATYSVNMYPRHPEPKTDLSIRFLHHANWLEYEIEWNENLPSYLAERFISDIDRALRAGW